MTFEIAKLADERNRLATEMREMVATAEKEDRGFNADERELWERKEQGLQELDDRIKVIERANAIDPNIEEMISGDGTGSTEGHEVNEEDQRREAFDALLRSSAPGTTGLSRQHQEVLQRMWVEERAQSTADAAGGYTIPEEMRNSIETAMLAFSGIRGISTVISTSTGGVLNFPTVNDTGNVGAILAENTQDSEQDVTFAELVLNAYKYTSKMIRVSVELLQDSAFDLNSYLGARLGERLGRATAAHYATGTGSSQPNGLMTAAATGVTAASGSAITYAEIIDLKHSVDPAYRGNARFLMNDSTLKAVKNLLDGDNRPLWQPEIAQTVPATLDGDQFTIDQGVASIGTSAAVMAYGDMSKYLIRDVRGITLVRLVERYADFHQVAFVAFMRTDADLLDAGVDPVKKMVMAAA